MAELLDSMLDLMRRLPPTNVEENVSALVSICPEYADDLLGSVDQPLRVMVDRESGREYLGCDYNRDGDSYRSPWSNEYDPPLDDGTAPSPKLRKLEIAANDAFNTYREMYFEGGVSSVYLWDLEDGGFAGAVVLKKVLSSHSGNDDAPTGAWDSIHVFEANERGRTAHYKLTSTVMLHLVTHSKVVRSGPKGGKGIAESDETGDAERDANGHAPGTGSITLSGSMTRQIEQDHPLADASSHVANTGRMVEEQELRMRNTLQDVYFGKTRDVVAELRAQESLEQTRKQRELQKELVGMFKAKK